MELVREHFGLAGFAKIIQKTFGQLYKTQILNGKMIVQSNKDIF
jgi:folate-dependent phosphoribosylglycinamide formyltransferase PurN